MSTLPNIDAEVTQELNSQLSAKTYEAIQYKKLAEALLTERDQLQATLNELQTEPEDTPISGTVVGD